MLPLDVITAEARAQRTVVVEGYEKDGSIERREIEPYSLRPGTEGTRLMFWCLVRNGMRSLFVHNLVQAEATGRSYVPRFPIEL